MFEQRIMALPTIMAQGKSEIYILVKKVVYSSYTIDF